VKETLLPACVSEPEKTSVGAPLSAAVHPSGAVAVPAT
jgi:hypothetical protein